jgi:hypothetical protein
MPNYNVKGSIRERGIVLAQIVLVTQVIALTQAAVSYTTLIGSLRGRLPHAFDLLFSTAFTCEGLHIALRRPVIELGVIWDGLTMRGNADGVGHRLPAMSGHPRPTDPRRPRRTVSAASTRPISGR